MRAPGERVYCTPTHAPRNQITGSPPVGLAGSRSPVTWFRITADASAVRAQVGEAAEEQAAAAARRAAFALCVAVVLAVLELLLVDPVAGEVSRVL